MLGREELITIYNIFLNVIMINIPTNNAISILFIFAITPAEERLLRQICLQCILGKIRKEGAFLNALIKFSMNLCFESIFPTNNPRISKNK